jgi:hypothetical protein
MYWCLQLYDKYVPLTRSSYHITFYWLTLCRLWSHFYGHPPTLPLLPSHSSLPSVQEWQDHRLWAQNTNGPGSKSMQSTTLHWTARLVEVVEEILYTVYAPVSAMPTLTSPATVSEPSRIPREHSARLPCSVNDFAHGGQACPVNCVRPPKVVLLGTC